MVEQRKTKRGTPKRNKRSKRAYAIRGTERVSYVDLSDDNIQTDLIRGIVWAELLSPPVSKRKGRGRFGL